MGGTTGAGCRGSAAGAAPVRRGTSAGTEPSRRGAPPTAEPVPGRVSGIGGTTGPAARTEPDAPDAGRACGMGPADDGRASDVGAANELDTPGAGRPCGIDGVEEPGACPAEDGRVGGTGGVEEPGPRPAPDVPGSGRAWGIGPAVVGRACGTGGVDEAGRRPAPDIPDAAEDERACGVEEPGPRTAPDIPESGRAAEVGRVSGIGGAGGFEGRVGPDAGVGGVPGRGVSVGGVGGRGGVRGLGGACTGWSCSRPTSGGASGKRAEAGGGGAWDPEAPGTGVSGCGTRGRSAGASAPLPPGAVPALPSCVVPAAASVRGVRVPKASKGSALRQGDHTPVGPDAVGSAAERPPDLPDTGREPSPPDTALPFLPPPGDASGPAPPVAETVSLCASEPSVPIFGGRDGRGGKEACRGSVVMHPPFPRAPGRLLVREPWSLRSFAGRRVRRGRSPRAGIPVRADRHPGAAYAALAVPPYVRVTLRLGPVGTGTSPRARGICPERPPTLR